jgi:hypothetical protein
MRTVWKFPVVLEDGRSTCFVDAPVGTLFVKTAWQGEVLVMWGLVPDDGAPRQQRVVEVVGTGRERFLGNLTYLDTAVLHGSRVEADFVLHVFVDGQ